MFLKKLANLRKAQTKFVEVESDQAGSLGERLAFEQLEGTRKSLNCKSKCYRSLRVSRQGAAGKFEIDLVMASKVGVLVVEVKHWGGNIMQEKGGWIQVRGQDVKPVG